MRPFSPPNLNDVVAAPPAVGFPHEPKLRILHVFRAPVGGLFRHVCDLARGQIARGHQVGFILDSMTGGARAEAILAEFAPTLALGMQRLPMHRQLGFRDIACIRRVSALIAAAKPDIVHGHGAKGAAYGRLSRAAPHAIRAYTPHGGSLVYRPGTLGGLFYRTLERILIPRTDLFLFESVFARDIFLAEVGQPGCLSPVVCNGVAPSEFAPIAPLPDATDLVFIGELRPVKGIDVLIDAIATLHAAGRPVTASLVGDGPDRACLEARVAECGLTSFIRFLGAMPARQAFASGRLMVVPSRAESLPYVVLEAAAAALPIISTRVGGIPEIFGPQAGRLIGPGCRNALSSAIMAALDDPAEAHAAANQLQERVRQVFAVDAMVDGAIAGYRKAIARNLAKNAVS
ncbi:MAG: putative teichuronic acid biosynthesis glycosyltransferase TuaC [Xanthobacteraceae bacterium]|nr:putative teichuronic acid biosynthesis glycosyltransferase TuaC [Xanthobacteraceae bacterium]